MAKKRRSRKKRKSQTSEDLFRSSREDRVNRRRQKRRLLPNKYVIALVLVALFVFFLPALVMRTPLKQVVLNRAFSDFNGKISVETVKCGWIANTELHNVVATNEQGEELFAVKSLKLRKSLTSMMNATDFGTIEIDRPNINLVMRRDGSNLEDAIAGYLNAESSGEAPPAFRLSVNEARILLTDAETKAQYHVESGTTIVNAFQPDEAPLLIDVEGKIADASKENEGEFKATVVIDGGKDKLEFHNGRIEIASTDLPIGAATPVLSRFVEPMAISGVHNGEIVAAWDSPTRTIDVQLTTALFKNLVVAAPNRIGTDQIQLSDAWLKGHVLLTPETLEADNLICQTDVGDLKADGKMNWEHFNAVPGATIPNNNFQADATVKLAPLIAMLPNTLPLQEGLAIESGKVQFNANSQMVGLDRRLVMNVESAGLTAIRNGQRLNWDKPARIVAEVRQNQENQIFLESLTCDTNFIQLTGSATTEQGTFTINGDLKSALAEVKQFFDLGELQVEGVVDGRFEWKFFGSPMDKLTSRPMKANGRFKVQQPLVNLPGQTSWAQPEINVVMEAAGQMLPVTTAQPRTIRLDSGKVEMFNAGQSFSAVLAEAVQNPGLNSIWNLDCKLGGDMNAWLSQVGTFIPVNAKAAGMVDASARITLSPQQIAAKQAVYSIRNLEFQGYGVTLSEELVDGQAEMMFQRGTGLLEIQDATIASSVISARGQNVKFSGNTDSGAPGTMTGSVAYQANVNQLMAAIGQAPGADAVHWFGLAQGTLELATSGDSITCDAAMKVTDFTAARFQRSTATIQNVSSNNGAWVPLLQEKEIELGARLSLDRSLNSVAFDSTRITASALQADASGNVEDLNGVINTNIRGTWTPDWQRLKPLVDSMIGRFASIEGVQGGAFEITGPAINPNKGIQGQSWLHPQLKISASSSWQSGRLLDMPVGGSNVYLLLERGVLAANTDSIPFSGGKVNVSPRIDLSGQDPVLFMPAGRNIDSIELTPEICRGWLKFVAPMLADATQMQGKFSIDTSRVHVPLSNPSMASVEGQAILHGANVGPGPLSQQLIAIVEQVKSLAKGQPVSAASAGSTWIQIPEQNVPFMLSDGRIFHQGMKFQIDDVIIQTRGSVGLDQSMQLVVDIPIMNHWVGDNRWAQGLRGQTLQIPVEGTVSSPRVDSRSLQRMSQDLVKQAAGAAVNREVQGLIDKGNQKLEEEISNGLKGLFGRDK